MVDCRKSAKNAPPGGLLVPHMGAAKRAATWRKFFEVRPEKSIV
jgi:hypothetical protein